MCISTCTSSIHPTPTLSRSNQSCNHANDDLSPGAPKKPLGRLCVSPNCTAQSSFQGRKHPFVTCTKQLHTSDKS
jgi:hypothetical protein